MFRINRQTQRKNQMNQAERESVELVNQAVNMQLTSDLGLRMRLLKNEITQLAEETQAIIHDMIAKYNAPMTAHVKIELEVDSVNLNKHVQKVVDAHAYGLPMPKSEPLEMY